jgi:hypothetical protein
MTFSDLIRLSPRLWLLLCLWLVGGALPNVYVACGAGLALVHGRDQRSR